MIITVQGYNNKKNKANFVATALSAFLAMGTNRKVLAVNLMNSDTNTIERLATGIGNNQLALNDMESRLAEEGIDQLLREADVQKLMKADFDRYVTPVLRAENKFDIATVTKNDTFEAQLMDKQSALVRMLIDAKAVYEDVVLLLPHDNKEVSDMVHSLTEKVQKKNEDGETEKPLVDYSIYCICQGFPKAYDVSGKNIIYLITNYEDTSMYKFSDIQRKYVGAMAGVTNVINNNNISCMKLSYSVGANDATYAGSVARFVKNNRELNKDDINYNWTLDMRNLCAKLTGEKLTSIAHDWESAEYFDDFSQSFDDVEDYIPEDELPQIDLNVVNEAHKEAPLSRREQRRLNKELKAEEKKRKDEQARLAREADKKRKEEEAARLLKEKKEKEDRERKEKERLEKIETARKAKEDAEKKAKEIADMQALLAKQMEDLQKANEAASKAVEALEEDIDGNE